MEEFKDIYKRYLDGYCSKQELDYLLKALSEHNELHTVLENELKRPATTLDDQTEQILSQNLKVVKEKIRLEKMERGSKKSIINLFRTNNALRYAAACIFIVSLFSILYWQYQTNQVEYSQNAPLMEILPATDQATLFLNDGTAYTLKELKPGQSLTQNGVTFVIGDDGSLTYSAESGSETNDEEIYHTMTTPKGGTYRVNLPDNSTIWLNAGSTVRYPIRFKGSKRIVSLDQGEAFFDITHMPEKPFQVKTTRETIEVLGTQFNVSAYTPNSIVTTLVSGRVKLTHNDNEMILQPSQQAIWMDKGFSVKTVDVAPYVSWQSGWFIFHNAPLIDVLHQLERWYDIEVDYNNLPNRRFYAEINRNLPLSEVLDMIQANSQTTFEMKGGKLYVK